MRELNGVHWSNGPQWHIEQCLRAIGSLGALTCLHFQLTGDPLLGMSSEDENLNLYGKWRYGFEPQGIPARPEMFIHIRVYHPNSLTMNPREWAEHIVNLLKNWRGSRDHAHLSANLWDDPYVGVSSGNEMNLHHENGDPNVGNQWMYQTVEWYNKIAAWDEAFWARVDELVPNRKALRVSPAFADGHEPNGYPADGEYTIPAVQRMCLNSDLIGIHPYAILHENQESGAVGKKAYWYMLRPFRPLRWEGPRDIGGALAQFPHKLFLVTETGTFTHSNVGRTEETWNNFTKFFEVAAASQRCVGVTWFIWHSDGAHPGNTIWLNEKLRGLLENAPRYAAPDLPKRGISIDPLPKPTPEVPMPVFNPNPYGYIVGPGMVRKATEMQWTILSAEIYHDSANSEGKRLPPASECFCDKGRLYHHDKTGTLAVPFE